MNKAVYICVLMLSVFSIPAVSEVYYHCGFEPNEQINTWGDHVGEPAFVTGWIENQGDPGWYGTYWDAYDISGDVVDHSAFKGTQCMHLTGYRTSDLTLDEAIFTPVWVEFAFRPNFDGSNPSAAVWMKETRGPYYDWVGFTLRLNAGTGKMLIIIGYPYTEIVIGDFQNNEWQTISFRHRGYEYLGVQYLTGVIDVFLGQRYTATIDAGVHFHAMGSVVFSSASNRDDHINLGDWFIDEIYIGDEPVLAGYPEHCGGINTVYLAADLSGPEGVPDCYVDLYDLQALAEQWLQ